MDVEAGRYLFFIHIHSPAICYLKPILNHAIEMEICSRTFNINGFKKLIIRHSKPITTKSRESITITITAVPTQHRREILGELSKKWSHSHSEKFMSREAPNPRSLGLWSSLPRPLRPVTHLVSQVQSELIVSYRVRKSNFVETRKLKWDNWSNQIQNQIQLALFDVKKGRSLTRWSNRYLQCEYVGPHL